MSIGSPYYEPHEPVFFNDCWFILERADINGDLDPCYTYGVEDDAGNISLYPTGESVFFGATDFGPEQNPAIYPGPQTGGGGGESIQENPDYSAMFSDALLDEIALELETK